MATFLSCLQRAFAYIGGTPREILFDNAKVVVSERVGKIVRFNENLLHFALGSGFTPRESAPPFVIEQRHATRTNLISVEGNQYSVPSRLARQQVRFRRYESHLELLDGQNVVDTIQLEYGRGRRIIRDEHYPAHERARQRTAASNPLQARFEGLAPEVPAYLQGLSRTQVGGLREQMEKIVTLAETYPPAAISRAMQRVMAGYTPFQFLSVT